MSLLAGRCPRHRRPPRPSQPEAPRPHPEGDRGWRDCAPGEWDGSTRAVVQRTIRPPNQNGNSDSDLRKLDSNVKQIQSLGRQDLRLGSRRRSGNVPRRTPLLAYSDGLHASGTATTVRRGTFPDLRLLAVLATCKRRERGARSEGRSLSGGGWPGDVPDFRHFARPAPRKRRGTRRAQRAAGERRRAGATARAGFSAGKAGGCLPPGAGPRRGVGGSGSSRPGSR